MNCDLTDNYCETIHLTLLGRFRRLWRRGLIAARRYLRPFSERYFSLDLAGSGREIFKKRALLSYITHPFSIQRDDQRFYRHINIWHAQEIVRVLNRMGFSVDAIDYRDEDFRPEHTYELFIGHGGINFSRLAGLLPRHAPKIYFSTGAYWKFHNKQEILRFDALLQRRGVRLPFDRFIHQNEEVAIQTADGILGIGNRFTRQTYADFPNVQMLDGTSLSDTSFDRCQKDYESGRHHFVFFSGRGNIHKGLDLVLEAFSGIEQHIWICTPLEKDFAAVYNNELKLPNIHVIGWLQPRSKHFYQVMQTCNFCILPSCSEGQSQSVVECMNQGLIPLVSQETGLDVKNFGFIIENCSPPEIRKLVQEAAAFQPQYCQELSHMARQAALNDFSEAKFSQNLQSTLEALLQ